MDDKIKNVKLNESSKIVNLLFIAALVITIISFLIDLKNTLTYPGTDLRNRVVGARLMLEGIDPYFFKWQPGLSERFYDPLDVPTALLSKLSVPPTVLVIHSLFAGLPYLYQKIIWLLIQWGALIGITFIFIKTSNSRAETNLILITSFLFVNSLFWRFHVNSGQIYIVYVFLLSLAWLSLKKLLNYRRLISGVFVGIAISMRPSFILFFIPSIVSGEYLFCLGGILGVITTIALSIPVVGGFIWQKYAITMLGMTGIINLNTYSPLKPLREKIISNSNVIYPKTIEGFDPSIRNPLERYLDNTSLYDVLNALSVPNKRYVLLISFAVTMLLISWYVWKLSRNHKNINLLFLWGTLISLIGDFFIPVGRYSYYDVQMILPLLIIISCANVRDLIYEKSIVILLLGFILGIAGFIIVPRALFFSVFLIILYIVLVSFMLLNRNSKSKNKTLKV